MATVTLKSVSKTYANEIRAVESVDLAIADGEFIVLVGPSGCGKSTTLRMIAGLEDISSGTIAIGDRTVNDIPPKDRNIAMVFQNYALYPHLNVRQNLSFGLERRRSFKSRWRGIWDAKYRSQRRAENDAIAQRVDGAARTLGIEKLLARQPRELSGGQRQRVAVGRALVRDPSVFLFDEPLSNLDALLRGEMRTELRLLHRTLRATMVYVTHDQEEAMSLADRIVVMKDGIVQQIGSPLDIYERPANRFVAGFIGTPPMNMIKGTLVRSDDGRFLFRWNHRDIPLPQGRWQEHALESALLQSVILGVRPESALPSLSRGAHGGGDQSSIVGVVATVERYGATTDVVVDIDGVRFISRCAAQHAVGIADGAQVSVAVDANAAHIFDSRDGQAVAFALLGK